MWLLTWNLVNFASVNTEIFRITAISKSNRQFSFFLADQNEQVKNKTKTKTIYAATF